MAYVVLTESIFGNCRTLHFDLCDTEESAKKMARLIIKAYRENSHSVFCSSDGNEDDIEINDFLDTDDKDRLPTISLFTKVGGTKHDFKLSVCCAPICDIKFTSEVLNQPFAINIASNATLTRDKLTSNNW